jgi:hypothetical protein
MSTTSQIRYLVLPDRYDPYFLAMVRWPDVAQAISLWRNDWQEDPGLFDLPYASNSVEVSYAEAAVIASCWGAQLSADTSVTTGVPFIRRMPADWTVLSRAEKQAWSLDLVNTRRDPTRKSRRLRERRAAAAAGSHRRGRHSRSHAALPPFSSGHSLFGTDSE